MSDIYATKLKQDLHGNILITNGGVSAEENTFIKVGSAAPKYNLGFRNSFSWKGLELDFLIDARVGGEVISATQALMDQFGVSQQTAVLETMTPSQLSSAAPQSVSTTVGKLIQGSAWYFAANVNEENAASLKENSRLTLRMASGVGFDLPVTLTRISAAENGKCLIVLKSTRYLSYMTLLREQNAELIISAYDGLRVPKNALRVDENGVSGVYCLVGRVAYFKPVSIVYQGSDYCLVEPGTIEAATESQKSLYTLRPNDEVIVSAGELYNGKVVD